MCDFYEAKARWDVVSADTLADALDALAEALGCPVALEDRQFRVLAYSAVPGQVIDPVRSEAIVQRRTPERWLLWIDKVPGRRAQLDSGDPLLVEDAFPGLRRRMIKSVRSEGGVVGYLWVLEGGAGFPPTIGHDLADFERRVAPIISLLGDQQRWASETRSVRLLLAGDATHESLAGTGIGAEWLVTAATVVNNDSGHLDYQDLEELSDAVRQAVRGHRGHTSLTGVIERRVCRLDFYAALPSKRASRDLERCVSHGHQRLRRPLVMAVGRPMPICDINKSWLQARAAAEQLTGAGDHSGRFGLFDDLQAECVTSAVASFLGSRPELVEDLVHALEDRGKGDVPERSRTIRAYLDHSSSIPRAARELNLHPNSLRYRITRIQRDLPLDLDDPVGRLALHLASLIRRTP